MICFFFGLTFFGLMLILVLIFNVVGELFCLAVLLFVGLVFGCWFGIVGCSGYVFVALRFGLVCYFGLLVDFDF